MDDEVLTYDEVMERLWPEAKAWWIEVFYDEYSFEVDTSVYWRCVVDIWSMGEFPAEHEEVWREVWADARWDPERPGRGWHPADPEIGGLSAEERGVLAGLPDLVEVFRGFQGEDWRGFAWTLDRERAEWFARRFAVLAHLGAPAVVTGTVPRSAILAYIDGRNEQEVVLLPEAVVSIVVSEVASGS